MSEDDPENLIDPPFNSSDPVQVNERRKKLGRQKQRSLTVVEALMQHKDGRAWLNDLIVGTDYNGHPVVQGDPYLTYYNLGQMNVGKRILAEAQEFTDLYLKMIQEARKK